MWQQTALSHRLGLAAPIIQGPFGGGLSSVDLTVAVAEAGGLGSFGVHHLNAAQMREVAAGIRARTQRPFALNLWVPVDAGGADPDQRQISAEDFSAHVVRTRPLFDELGVPLPTMEQTRSNYWPSWDEQIETLLDIRPAVFSFVYGVPSASVLAACRERGITSIGTATTVEEARVLEAAGVDFIVATGFEAGGHRVSFLRRAEDVLTGSMALLPQVVDAVGVPVIAAGGIADGRGIAAALALGAQGVQIGTAFLACRESNASAIHREKLFSPAARDTALTRVFSGRLARGIRNRLMREAGDEAMPGYPLHTWWMGQLKSAAMAQGRDDLMALWAGQSAALLRHHQAGELFDWLVADTDACLRRLQLS